ncbi:MAG: efflux RND transporter periplasmic adaptor subunit [Beijerinckiaceae bacterium]
MNHRLKSICRRSIVSLSLGFLWIASSAIAHDGHDHGAPPPPVSATIAPRADASSADFEIVAVARGDTLTLILDSFAGNAPVQGAEIEIDTPQGTQKAVAEGDGVYRLAAPWLAKPGAYDLAITVHADGAIDVLTATLTIPAQSAAGSGKEAPGGARDVAQRFADGALFVPKTTQRILALRTAFTEVKTYAGSVELPGRIIPDPNGVGYVQASVSGRLMPPPGGFPRLGTPVKAGDILGHVHPGVGAADVTTQQLQARELEQQVTIVTRRLDRLRQIQTVVPRSQIEDAELELAGLNARRANLDRAPRHTEDLVAPVSGVIAAVQATAGQIADPNAIIFQIIDPGRFWVEALSYDAQAIAGAATARLADNRTIALAYRGMGLAERNQSIPIHFGIEGETKGLRAGQFLTVLATTVDEKSGVAVPRSAILRGANGQSLVFEHTNAERFVPREVRVEPLDAGRVLIVSGIGAGKRIATQGAELLNQIR